MEHKIAKKYSEFEIAFAWRCPGGGNSSIHIDDTYVKKYLLAFAETSKMDLDLDIAGNMPEKKQLMEKLGCILAEVICECCTEIRYERSYRGVGTGSFCDGKNKVDCELHLPGRVNWVCEILSGRTEHVDPIVLEFFDSLAGTAGIRLQFHIHGECNKSGEGMFAAFGEALYEAFSDSV